MPVVRKTISLLVAALPDEPLDDVPLQVEDLIDGGRLLDGDLPAEAVDDDHDVRADFPVISRASKPAYLR